MGRYVYQWPQSSILCVDNDDATMLALKFGGRRELTKVEQMARDADDDDIEI